MNSPLQIWHPFTQEALDPPPMRIAKAEGAYLYTDDGRRLIDGISSWWVNIHGHGHPAIIAAIAAQAARIDHVLLAGFTHDAAEELRGCLRKDFARQSLAHLFFGRRLDGRRSRAEDGGAVLAECGAPGEKGDRCARSRVSRRYGRGDVGRRGVFIHGPVSRAAVSRASRAFGLLLSMPRGENARDLLDRLRGSVGAAARRKARRDCGGDRRAAACRAQAE